MANVIGLGKALVGDGGTDVLPVHFLLTSRKQGLVDRTVLRM